MNRERDSEFTMSERETKLNLSEREKFYDDLLERSLAGYNAEPRTGLEHRVLAGVRAHQAETKRAWWWRWQFAGAAAAAMILLAVGVTTLRRQEPQLRPVAQRPVSVPQQNSLARSVGESVVQAPSAASPKLRLGHAGRSGVHSVENVVARRAVSAAMVTAAVPPRLAVFPSAAPLSEQERLLADVAHNADPTALRALAAAASAEEPLAPPMVPVVEPDNVMPSTARPPQ